MKWTGLCEVTFVFFQTQETPLHQAAINGYTEVVSLLIQAGGNPNATDEVMSNVIFSIYVYTFIITN